MKSIIITAYTMEKFYGAGIFQTTIAYATAFKKLGYSVKLLVNSSTPLSSLKLDNDKSLTWLGLEYINMEDLNKLNKVDYLIYMGWSSKSFKKVAMVYVIYLKRIYIQNIKNLHIKFLRNLVQ
jgi:hypothetical protein